MYLKNISSFLILHVILLLFLLSASGCRNEFQEVETVTRDCNRKLLYKVPAVEVLKKNESSSFLQFKVTENRTYKVEEFNVYNTNIRFTPYEGWRELYEIPMSFVLIPLGVGSHVLNICTLGLFPFSWCANLDCIAFSALNPFMNTESDSRYEEETIRTRRELIDTKEESQTYLMRKTLMTLKAGNSIRRKFTGDSGIVHFDLLELSGRGVTLDSGERNIQLFMSNNSKPIYQKVISRNLQTRMLLAKKAILRYKAKKSGTALAGCVRELENLQFSFLSYHFEKQQLNEHIKDRKFRADFEKASFKKRKK